jgi:hypothetical protein
MTEEEKAQWLSDKLTPIVAQLRAVDKEYAKVSGDGYVLSDYIDNIEGFYLY